MDYFSQNMRWLRNRNNLSQEAFGSLFDLTRGKMDTYERGKAWPPVEVANKICKHFNITLDQFFNQELSEESIAPQPADLTRYQDPVKIIESLEQDKEDLRKAKATGEELIERLIAENKELKASLKLISQKR